VLRITKQKLAAAIINPVLQESNPHRKIHLAIYTLSAIDLFASGPIRVIGGMIITFRMGHQAKYSPARVTDTGNIVDRSIGIERKATVGGRAIGQAILNRNLVLFSQFSQRRFIGKKFAFTVANREFRKLNIPGKYTR
jgi:hypothetical protein